MSSAPRAGLLSFGVGVATAVLVVAVAVLPFLTPAWVAFAQDRAGAAALTGFAEADLRTATNALLRDVVIGPPAFDVAVDGTAVLTEPERAHLRDVRGVFTGLAVLAAAGVAALAIGVALRRHDPAFWRGVRGGSLMLSGAVSLLGLVAVVAFEPAFALFHRLLFAGNFTFDPQTDRLVQLFPDQLWFETSIAVGVLIVALGLVVAWRAGNRLADLIGTTPAGRDADEPWPGFGQARP